MTARSSARLTDTKINNAKQRERPYKLSDGGGLYLAVHPTGAKCWRYRYRIGGKENLFALGEYPQVTLKAARVERDRARELVKQGIHPAADRRAQRLVVATQAANTFETLANEWIQKNKKKWSPYYLSQVRTILAADVFPEIGKLPIKSVGAAHLMGIMKDVEERGAPTIAILIRQWSSAIFRYAIVNLRAEVDPAASLKGLVSKPRTKHKHALTQSELPEFLSRLDESQGAPQVEIAMRLLLLTFVRTAELRKATWSEFDLERALWEIPAERMKMRTPHLVPLSKQALELLRRLKAIDGSRPLLFPNHRDPTRPMCPTTLNRRLERMGYAGYFSAHGFRATATTRLVSMGWSEPVVDRQLAHQERNKTRRSYNHAAFMDERVPMMQAWADFLDALQSGASVVPFRRGKGQEAA
jgi:integrase